ncbi:bifunctional diaminohydroxyphosphoribosylaminopyrimidine deaminase/5-amino-6-(5-phosphoribosylamino)uracil reductase RibD [Caldalkalibacillus salinus]|uniref:bifunctional diaminohydroxyphosphoribosylaminopyrimidine deaminase/5-amino-6-(5-phosphoribosylamino)uracil reductase RibD n=1 Tax=Caldalkalibacillus salinus TaxID=2803787 RepID=UPI0023517DF8|nr:bifunctional diaminohydroxyphosphoribosylaminopyrimidine deaminase/5-amino-6-(5-phosphoribosylamino)uracil reductase RibD [Caldalkalibacillus salinus]
MSQNQHLKYMSLALDLAAAQRGQTSPNPMVGAVIVKDHQIVGMGAHLRAGEAHAEVHALNMAGDKAQDSTMYVTLEPCSHFGRTPPCADQVIEAGIRKVFVATLDPNPLVAGRGINKLEEAGIDVNVGLLGQEATDLNEAFNYYILHKRPYVTLKTATTLDGKIATVTGESQWITNEASRADVHILRHEHDAILVGVQTVVKDDPQLTTRIQGEQGHHPTRVILDSALSVPIEARILDTSVAPTWIFTTDRADAMKKQHLEARGVKVITVGDGPRVSLDHVLNQLGEQKVTSLLVEGGGAVNATFLKEHHVHRMVQYIAPKLIGGNEAPTPFRGTGMIHLADALVIENIKVEQLGDDIKVTGHVKKTG